MAPALTIDEQKTSLKEFKQLVTKESWYKPTRHSSKLLKRFLIARQWNHEKALKMMSNTEAWREKNDMDNINEKRLPTFLYNTFTKLTRSDDLFDFFNSTRPMETSCLLLLPLNDF
jgi:hypothetical protein